MVGFRFGAVLAAAMALAVAAEEELKVSTTSLAVCLMLMGTVGSTMGAFYLVNHSDPDIKTSTWRVICNTISIFAAVLLFQAFNGWVTYMFLEGVSPWVTVVVSFIHSAFWFAVLQFFLAFVSRSFAAPKFILRPLPKEDGPARDDLLETIRLDLKCWGILFGHIAGFASINAWCVIQQFFHKSLLGSLLVIPGASVSLWLTFLITDMARERIAMAGDGIKDENEVMWDESVTESEEDVRALTLSFLSVQWLRFFIFGVLPSAEGDLPADRHYTSSQLLTLLGFSVVIAIWNNVPGRYCCKNRIIGKGEAATLVRMILNLVFAWSLMYTFRTWLLTNHYLHQDASGEVLQAVVLTWGTFGTQHVLDYLADLDATGKETDDALRSIIATLSVLVGFSWEKCFDVAVDNIAVKVKHLFPEECTKVVMAFVLVASVLPAWRWYILPVLDRLELLEEEEEEENGEEPPAYKAYKVLEEGGVGEEVRRRMSERVSDREGCYVPPKEVSFKEGENEKIAAEMLQKLQDLQGELSKAGKVHKEALEAAKRSESEKVTALEERLREMEENGQQQVSSQIELAAREKESLQQQLQDALMHGSNQDSRVGAALQAEQEQRTRVFQLEGEKSSLQAQLQDMATQLSNSKQSHADESQLRAEISDLQLKYDTAVRGQASCQAEQSQFVAQMQDLKNQLAESNSLKEKQHAEFTAQLEAAAQEKKQLSETHSELLRKSTQIVEAHSQLEMTVQDHAFRAAAQDARIAELESQLSSEQSHSRELGARLSADAERRAGLEALITSLHEEKRAQQALQPDELTHTLAGIPVSQGVSGEYPAAPTSPPMQVQREPVAAPSMGQRLLQAQGLVPNIVAPPLLTAGGRSAPSSPESAGQSAVAKGPPLSPGSPTQRLQPRAVQAPPPVASVTSPGSSNRLSAKAASRKTPALQPGQAPAAPRLSSSDPALRGRGPGMAQGRAPGILGGSSSGKEAVAPAPRRPSQGGFPRLG